MPVHLAPCAEAVMLQGDPQLLEQPASVVNMSPGAGELTCTGGSEAHLTASMSWKKGWSLITDEDPVLLLHRVVQSCQRKECPLASI